MNNMEKFEKRLRLISFAFITLGIILVICNSIIAQNIVNTEISNVDYLESKFKYTFNKMKNSPTLQSQNNQTSNATLIYTPSTTNLYTLPNSSSNITSSDNVTHSNTLNIKNPNSSQTLLSETILITLFSHIRYENLACRSIMTGLFFILVGVIFYIYILLAKIKHIEQNI